jgi:hypothetical protein
MPTKPTTVPQPIFDESSITPDPTGFKTPHPSDNPLYKKLGNAITKNAVGFQPARGKPADLYTLASALGPNGPQIVSGIQAAGQIVFHAAGDTGASDAGNYGDELSVADQVSQDCHTAQPGDVPAFFYNLGDIVYNFGESKYYYDQFYDPYRNYPGPIFAIPGNHDSFIIPGTTSANQPLTIFTRNFCAKQPQITQEAASLHRTAMTQPGVYFTLDAPFVRIIGLFSNALEDPGLISSEKGNWPGVPDTQLAYLTAQLQQARDEKYQGALLIATHHPAFCYTPPAAQGGGGDHSSSLDMLHDIDTICQSVGIYPHAFLSGHAHNYQRYTRTVKMGGKTYDVPFVICGCGGHNVSPLVTAAKGQPAVQPVFGSSVNYMDVNPAVSTGGLLLEKYDGTNYGYLRVSVDAQNLRIGYHQAANGTVAESQFDLVTVDLASHTMVAN